LNICTVSNRL